MSIESKKPAAKRPSGSVTIAGHYARMILPEPPAGRPYVSINMVTSLDGKATIEGSERGIGSADDKRMMQELRVHADAVMNGASTLRISGSTPRVRDAGLKAQRLERGLQPQPLGVVVSRSGELPLDVPFFISREFDAVIFLTETTPPDRVAAIRATGRRVVIVPDGPGNVRYIVEALRRDFGVRHLLCEGGPTVNRALMQARVADEIFLTLAPKIVAGTENLTAVEGPAFERSDMLQLRLKSHLVDDATDELYLRYAISYP
jgi:2,5-diamino-6-(ribosylamino)-4(3H)-pyrimidinone 5'-phosphate reductase